MAEGEGEVGTETGAEGGVVEAMEVERDYVFRVD